MTAVNNVATSQSYMRDDASSEYAFLLNDKYINKNVMTKISIQSLNVQILGNANTGEANSFSLFRQAISGSTTADRQRAVVTLCQTRIISCDGLIRLTSDTCAEVRAVAAKELVEFNEPRSRKAILLLLFDEVEAVRHAAIDGISELQSRRRCLINSICAITPVLASDEARIRQETSTCYKTLHNLLGKTAENSGAFNVMLSLAEDHMTDIELILTMLAEATTTKLHKGL